MIRYNYLFLIIILVIIPVAGIKAQYIGAISVYPSNPLDTDSITIEISGEIGNTAIDLVDSSFFVFDSLIQIYLLFDGVAEIGLPIMLPFKCSLKIGVLPHGEYRVICESIFDGRKFDFEDTTFTVQSINKDRPFIDSITDVPNDQGKQVLIRWQRSRLDSIGSDTTIIGYGVWRRVDHLSADLLTMKNEKEQGTDANVAENISTEQRKFVPNLAAMLEDISSARPGTTYFISANSRSSRAMASLTGFEIWTFVSYSPALQFKEYSVVAPTLFDSTKSGIVYSVFFVSAHTTNPQLWFASPPHSGYSIDNLAPCVPTGLIATSKPEGITLTWNPNSEDDFNYFTIFRGLQFNFIKPDSFFYSTENCFVDQFAIAGMTYYYRITACDFSGNESDPSNEIEITFTTNIIKTNYKSNEYGLGQNYPNPFNPSTTIEFNLPKAGLVSLKIYDMLGREVATLVDEELPIGIHRVNWNAQHLASGVYVCKIQAGDPSTGFPNKSGQAGQGFVQTKKMILMR